MSVGVAMITRNEAAVVRDTLHSMAWWADEIVIVDAESEDDTVRICREFTDRVFVRPWAGFTDQRNFSLAQMTTDWIFIVDADEIVTPELAAEIRAVTVAGAADAFQVPRLNWFWGRFLRWGGNYPDYALRLLRRGAGQYGDRLLHETIEVGGPVGTLQNPLLHYTASSMDHFFDKFDRVTRLGAQQLHRDGKKWSGRHLLAKPVSSFLSRFFLKRGYRDGWHGFIFAGLSAFQVFTRYARLWELEHSSDREWKAEVERARSGARPPSNAGAHGGQP